MTTIIFTMRSNDTPLYFEPKQRNMRYSKFNPFNMFNKFDGLSNLRFTKKSFTRNPFYSKHDFAYMQQESMDEFFKAYVLSSLIDQIFEEFMQEQMHSGTMPFAGDAGDEDEIEDPIPNVVPLSAYPIPEFSGYKSAVGLNVVQSFDDAQTSFNELNTHMQQHQEQYDAYAKNLSAVKTDSYGIIEPNHLIEHLDAHKGKKADNMLAAYHIMHKQVLNAHINNPHIEFKTIAAPLNILGTEIIKSHRAEISKQQLAALRLNSRRFQLIEI